MPAWDDAFADGLAERLEAFGEPVAYHPKQGAAFELPLAIFDRQSKTRAADFKTRETFKTKVSDFETVLFVRLSDFQAPPIEDDALSLRGLWFRVAEIDQDGLGGANLVLRKADEPPAGTNSPSDSGPPAWPYPSK